jgi:biotin carboxyl carrier protein
MAQIPVEALVTGKVWKIEVGEGATVAEGDTLLILESMKMEIPIEAPAAGRVREILVAVEDAVDEGQVVAVLDG